MGRADIAVDTGQFFHGLIANGYQELPIKAKHTVWVRQLEHHHNDPFDRLLIAQAIEENLVLMTSDTLVAKYDTAPILLVT